MKQKPKIENVYCVGRNFAAHATELSNKIPTEPIFFQKSNSSINLSNIIKIPKEHKIDYEVEVVLLIGKEGSPKNLKEAKKFISGYSLGIDLTKRNLQKKLKQERLPWFPSKSFEGSAVLDNDFKTQCPSIFYLEVNKERRQTGKIKNMIFSFENIVLHLSAIVELKQGDIIYTGTPKGVGSLNDGDKIKMGFLNDVKSKKYTVVS